MSQENVEVVRRNIDAYNRRDIEAYVATVAPGLVFHSTFGGVEGRTYTGHAGARQYFEDLREAWADYRLEVEEFVDAGGDKVIGLFHVVAEGELSGIKLERRLGVVYTVRGGTITEIDSYTTRTAALEAVGLSEQDAHVDDS
jgi:ketosteroid isomerase-like protein